MIDYLDPRFLLIFILTLMFVSQVSSVYRIRKLELKVNKTNNFNTLIKKGF